MNHNRNKKLITIMTLLFIYVLHCFSAFSEKEKNELNGIDVKSENDKTTALKKLDQATKKAIEDNPEKRRLILELRKSWDLTIEKKCQFEISESKGTNAETTKMNNCLVENYLDEIKYFDSILP
ncbi:hypothetical protein [Dickeya solani]|uniref:Lysozyme inhibitor LprI N-terminal domain-containing protein n=1 Tax=Dickeya solani TaxID=1089444 RepID=A0ABU4ECW5_9GAMM|nr:hypothetical protein [Dickeya solani]MCA7001160.1 hypothetical protein [Dickeya solani]MCZ0821599.1 hypothetical protein [Dickeya solani]MDV6996488.1 hypothetical protein [Dickeya solani]MDV7002263.1 hypothetical protein [Dickeya solani]MDV7037165.1 hypothetical protein [Dickeya solani]